MSWEDKYTGWEFEMVFDPDYRAQLQRTYGRSVDLRPWRLIINHQGELLIGPSGDPLRMDRVTQADRTYDLPALERPGTWVENATADVSTSRRNRVAIHTSPQDFTVAGDPHGSIERLIVSVTDPERLIDAVRRWRAGERPVKVGPKPDAPSKHANSSAEKPVKKDYSHLVDMVFNRVSFHLWPPVWIIESLTAADSHERDFPVERLKDQMYTRKLDCGVALSVQRQGIFTFDLSRWELAYAPNNGSGLQSGPEHYSGLRSAVINGFLACLYTAIEDIQPPQSSHPLGGMSKMWVTADDLMLSKAHESNATTHADTRTVPFMEAHMRSKYAGPAGEDWRHMGRIRVIQQETLDRSLDSLTQILGSAEPDIISIVALYQQACVTYEQESYGPAVVMAWAISEQMLSRLWNRYLENNRKRVVDGDEVHFISNKRKERLQDGRSFTSSVVAENLSLLNALPLNLYKQTVPARQARNNWVHDLEPAMSESARQAIETAESMLEFTTGVKLHERLVTFPWG